MSRTGFDRRDLLAIAVGGVIGAAVRWWFTDAGPSEGGWFQYAPNTFPEPAHASLGFPTRTLVVNLLGTFVLGVVLSLRASAPQQRRLWLSLGTGFCGSLTTFSTFATDIALRLGSFGPTWSVTVGSHEAEALVPPSPSGQIAGAAVYAAISILGAALVFTAGRMAVQRVVGAGSTTA